MLVWLAEAWWMSLFDKETRQRWTLRQRLYVMYRITFTKSGFERFVLYVE